jgi:hypothetical protein
MVILPKPLSFEWDRNNQDKIWQKHNVNWDEAEEVFFDQRKKLYLDPKHSRNELRQIIVGMTKRKRLLFIAFAVRKERIRIISARDLNKREEGLYEKTT